MASKALLDIIRQAEQLTPEEQKELVSRLMQSVGEDNEGQPDSSRGKWRSLRGMAPDLLDREDAQEWVSRTRQESDEWRAKQLYKGMP